MSKKIFLVLILLFISPSVFPQIDEISVGLKLGPGTISGNLPSQTSVAAELFVDVLPNVTQGIPLRLGLLYARRFEAFLPQGLRGKYYPFIKGVYICGILKQPLGKLGYLEESLGPLYLNDRTYSDVNANDIGVMFSLLIGLDFRYGEKSGFASGLGVEYGTTFTNTTARYTTVNFQLQYFF